MGLIFAGISLRSLDTDAGYDSQAARNGPCECGQHIFHVAGQLQCYAVVHPHRFEVPLAASAAESAVARMLVASTSRLWMMIFGRGSSRLEEKRSCRQWVEEFLRLETPETPATPMESSVANYLVAHVDCSLGFRRLDCEPVACG